MGASGDHVAVGCLHSRPALVERVEASLYLRLAVARIGKWGESWVLQTAHVRIIVRERVACGGERRDREQRHEGLEWVLHVYPRGSFGRSMTRPGRGGEDEWEVPGAQEWPRAVKTRRWQSSDMANASMSMGPKSCGIFSLSGARALSANSGLIVVNLHSWGTYS